MTLTLEQSQEITSKENQYIKLAKSLHQKKYRNEENLFLLEGKTLFREALKKNLNIKYVFAKEQKTLDEFTLPHSAQSFVIEEDLMEKIATTDSPAPIIAVAEKVPNQAGFIEIEESENQLALNLNEQKTEQGTCFLYCENIQDPGNLGSIIRTAFAAGINSIFLSPNTVDIYNPKALRSSMGGVFYGPIAYIELEDLIGKLKKQASSNKTNLEIIGTSPHAELNYNEVKVNPMKNILILAGSEAHGLSPEAEELSTELVKIPLENDVESINVLAATSVILFNFCGNHNRP